MQFLQFLATELRNADGGRLVTLLTLLYGVFGLIVGCFVWLASGSLLTGLAFMFLVGSALFIFMMWSSYQNLKNKGLL